MTATSPISPPIALTIAGTDSGGSAGLAADLKTFSAHRVHGVFAVTVVTAQNSIGIRSVERINAEMVGQQLDAVLDDFAVAATKTGLLFTPDIVDIVGAHVGRLGQLVVDPVLVTSTGEPMLDDAMPDAYRTHLFPHAAVCTPNVAEASLLTGIDVVDRATAMEAASAIHTMGPDTVVVTGLLLDEVSVDAVATSEGSRTYERERIDTPNVLGTGCSLSAATAAHLARGASVVASIVDAASFVNDGLRSSASWRLGAGRGPIDHFVGGPEGRNL